MYPRVVCLGELQGLKVCALGPREMDQLLRLDNFPEDLGSILNFHMEAHVFQGV